MPEEQSVHQRLVDQAYAKWQDKDWSYLQFIEHLDYNEKFAVLTGNLNAQVCNGGFSQWHENGYSEASDKLLLLMNEYINEPYVKEVVQIVEEAMKAIRSHQPLTRNRWGELVEDENEAELLYDALDELDSRFYEINEHWLETVESILNKHLAA